MIRTYLPASALISIFLPVSATAQSVPRPEHPRPQMMRDQWLCLNGQWQFCFDPRDIGVDDQWQRPNSPFAARADELKSATAGGSASPSGPRTIVVPFCWESKLSTVRDTSGQKIGWYRRTVDVPESWSGKRVWLRFEAVDWEARVWVNGAEVGRHEGGYTPFEFDISEHARPGSKAVITVRAFDPTDKILPTGKQVFWYTPTSGIWQTVWLEARPKAYISEIRLTPQTTPPSNWSLNAEVGVGGASGRYRVRFKSEDRSIPRTFATANVDKKDAASKEQTDWIAECLTVREPRLWTPDDPYLYNLDIELHDDSGVVDVVHTYFGLRTIARGKLEGKSYESILLNGRPIYLRGALDQSFNPDGIYTAPSDDFLKNDLEIAKRVGLNYLRIHIKPDEPRRLHWADRLGVLIMQDMPNTWVYSKPGQQAWEATMRGTIMRDRNHPSIIAWCLFNETWGLDTPVDAKGRRYRDNPDRQRWVEAMFRVARSELDSSRLIEDMSADKHDHVCGDFNSWHFYIDNFEQARRHIDDVVRQTYPGSPFNYAVGHKQDTAPLMNSEYGSVSAGGGDRDVSWGFRHLTTQLRRHEKCQGYVYTELSDIEWEHNGFVNYDRSPKQFGYDGFLPGMSVADLQGSDFVGFDAPPAIVVRPGVKFSVPVFVSHYSKRQRPPDLRWALVGHDDLGAAVQSRPTMVSVQWQDASVTLQKPIEAMAPTMRPFVGALTLELIDEGGKRVAGNFVNIISQPQRQQGESVSPRVESIALNKVALRFAPDDFAAASGGGPTRHGAGKGKFFAYGACEVEYQIRIPDAVAKAEPIGVEFLAELASKASTERLDWPARTNPQDYPQTDGDGFASLAELSIGGKALTTIRLKDDPADARGVLSHQAYFHHGSYGQLVREKLDTLNNPEILAALQSGEPVSIKLRVARGLMGRGLSVFGERTGRYPFDPTLIITTRRVVQSAEVSSMKSLAVHRYQDRYQQALATGEQGAGHVWRYTETRPADDWSQSGFDDLSWKSGKAGFGSRGTPSVGIGTRWRGADIWLRTQFSLPADFENPSLRLFHDEDVEIFLNGKPLLKRSGFTTAYETVSLTTAQTALFQQGTNTIAVHCRQTAGGQGIDLGIDFVKGGKN